MKTFNQWVKSRTEVIRENTIQERHKQLPSMFTRTHYALPTAEQIEEFQQFPDLTAEDIVQGFGYTIVGRGVNSPSNSRKIVESIRMLVDRYPHNETYQEALSIAKKDLD